MTRMKRQEGSTEFQRKGRSSVSPNDPHPFKGDKKLPCERCGGGFYQSIGHWRKP